MRQWLFFQVVKVTGMKIFICSQNEKTHLQSALLSRGFVRPCHWQGVLSLTQWGFMSANHKWERVTVMYFCFPGTMQTVNVMSNVCCDILTETFIYRAVGSYNLNSNQIRMCSVPIKWRNNNYFRQRCVDSPGSSNNIARSLLQC